MIFVVSLCVCCSELQNRSQVHSPGKLTFQFFITSPCLWINVGTMVRMLPFEQRIPCSANTLKVSAIHFSLSGVKTVGWSDFLSCLKWILLRMVVLFILYFLETATWTIVTLSVCSGLCQVFINIIFIVLEHSSNHLRRRMHTRLT